MAVLLRAHPTLCRLFRALDMAATLLLDRTAWDLCVDASGNIAVATEPYSLAQDAASAIRLFEGEYWYDTTIGIPYFDQILGHSPPIDVIRSYMQDAALTVPDIVSAEVFFSALSNTGQLSGQVIINDVNGNQSISAF
jgi:hypothetical protein